MVRKYHVAGLLNFYAICEVQSAGNATTWSIWFDDKQLSEVYATNDFTTVRRWQ